MALKKRYAKQDDIPEALRNLYKQAGNEFVLDLDGGDDDDGGGDEIAKKLAQFRENNRKLVAEQKARDEELTALRAKIAAFGDAEPAQVQAVLAALQGNDDKALIAAGKFDEVIGRRMKTREADWQKRLDDAAKAAEAEKAMAAKATGELAKLVLAKQMREAAAAKKVRLRATAEDDFLARAGRDFRVLDPIAGTLAPADDGAGFDKPEAYIDHLVRNAPHLFEDAGGGGAGGGGGRIGQNGVKVYRRSELSDKQYSSVLVDVAAGKAVVEMGK